MGYPHQASAQELGPYTQLRDAGSDTIGLCRILDLGVYGETACASLDLANPAGFPTCLVPLRPLNSKYK